MEEFKNKIVAITGGNSGIGLSTALAFENQGAKVAIFGRDQKKLDKAPLKNALRFNGDVCKIQDLENFYKSIVDHFGKIDVIIANAGIAEVKDLPEVEEDFFDKMVNINYKGLFFTVQRAIPYLNPAASIILVSSIAAHMGLAGYSVYCSTKAAVCSLARCFSADLMPKGIRVNSISPGFVDTPIFDDVKSSSPETIEKLSQTTLAKRFASSDEIADAILFLSSAKSSFMIGADLIIDGGLSSSRTLPL